MRVIDIDRLKLIDNHIHYIKEYEGSVILMDNKMQIKRSGIKFSIEYKPIGPHEIKIHYLEDNNLPRDIIFPKIKERIVKLDKDGVLAALHKN
ncbi:MAG TPA: hypothetical protein PLE45_05585 [Spirochaetota bacterium]|nr:hypothetical protein [Spirochaetota bacterium]HOL56535.1 hypothetical protein [Spirochaetota bacterium]HPP03635.1 hypothetical protein [Spirochaetota bacterium]